MINIEDSSFKDPSACVFYLNGDVYRQINMLYKETYDILMNSGLYKDLSEKGLLIEHEETNLNITQTNNVYKFIMPLKIDFITYPYEWCFSQLKDAALLTLKVQLKALEKGMTLKDASAYNIQFLNGAPVFIDTTSFEIYEDNKPWTAYRQFCMHFLCPLLLMHYKDLRLNQLFKIFTDGIPLDLTTKLLPVWSILKPMIFMNIYLHQRAEKHHSKGSKSASAGVLSKKNLTLLIESLYNFIEKLKYKEEKSEWVDYYNYKSYSNTAFESKKSIIEEYIEACSPSTVWDLGANTGEFSRLVSKKGIRTVSFDLDNSAVEKNYIRCKAESEMKILPLVLDITNPSPGSGWNNTERKALLSRDLPDCVLALALIHHLAISHNVPFEKIAGLFSDISGLLIIEFIPKDDQLVVKMLQGREDIFDTYTKENFEAQFNKYFNIAAVKTIEDSGRILYLLRKRV